MRKNTKAYAVVMAGGKGERFWPQSRLSSPKQLLRLLGNLTLIEQTIERLFPVFCKENIFVITNEIYVEPMRKLIPTLPPGNIIGECSRKDTAPCIASSVAFNRSLSKDPDPILCFLPADHVINDTAAFAKVVSDALDVADSTENIVTVGITPQQPQTGFGYIETGDLLSFPGTTKFRKALSFKEKPDLETAKKYFEAGCYKWNSGIFFARSAVWIKEFSRSAPELSKFIQETIGMLEKEGWGSPAFEERFNALKPISIDYAVMENAENVVCAEGSFDWDDVGSWTSLRNQIKEDENNNVIRGLHRGIGTTNCIIVGDSKKLIATVDVDDMVIVDTEDSLLVCSAKSAQKIKELVGILEKDPVLNKFV